MSSPEQRHPTRAAERPLTHPARASLRMRILRRFLPPLDIGHLTLELPDGTRLAHQGRQPGPQAIVIFHQWRALWRAMTGGEIGFAEAYMDGDCSSPDIRAFLQLILMNDHTFRIGSGVALVRLVNRLRHLWRRNTPRGSRRNIAAHYDLGNDFYAAWLDRGMNYSSAIFSHPEQTLDDAQTEKLARITALLDLREGQRVLEIGCGWGGLAERIRAFGCHVTGLTLSTQQLAFAQERLAAPPSQGTAERVAQGAHEGSHGGSEVRLQDYREVAETFDRVVSIEMIEAVGEQYWPAYFKKWRDCLVPGGVGVLQAITIDETRFAEYRAQPDFIQRYIFPGGMLPTYEAIAREVAKAGMTLCSVETFGDSYARTLALWRARFHQAWPAIEQLGFDLRFKRMWDYYLAYCEAGFRQEVINVGLFRVERPA